MIDKKGFVDGNSIIYDYTTKELKEQREAVEQEIRDSRQPLPDVPLTEAEARTRWNRRTNVQHTADMRNGIDRS